MSSETYLARRYIWDHREGFWKWIIGAIPTLSVAIGVAALIITLSIMSGFRTDIQNKMLGVHPHLYISSPLGTMNPLDSLIESKLSNNPNVAEHSPYVTGEILIGRGSQTSGGTIKGVDPIKEPQIANLEKKLTGAQWTDLEPFDAQPGDKPRIFLGKELALKIGARLGDVVWTITPGSIGISSFSLPKAHQFEVSGIIETGLYDYDSVIAYTNIPAAQKLFGLADKVSGMGVRLKDIDQIEDQSRQLQTDLEGRYWVRSWISLNANLFSALKLEKIVMFIVQTMVTIVAAFMIVSNLLLKISHKTKEIGILRAMGATSQTIQRTFLYQGLFMGFIGNIIGVILGIAGSLVIGKTDIIRLPADVYYIDHVPVQLQFIDIGFVVLFTSIIILIASLYPAFRAAKLDPIEAIRFG